MYSGTIKETTLAAYLPIMYYNSLYFQCFHSINKLNHEDFQVGPSSNILIKPHGTTTIYL